MHNILVTGASGQLGSEIRYLSESSDRMFLFTDVAELDITKGGAVKQFLDGNPVEAIINCSAYTAVDKAEIETKQADLVNREAVEILARECKNRGIRLVHISTDYVFDGNGHKPYLENDPVNPKNVYGRTKLEGEEAVRKINPEGSIIIRTSWVYSSYGNNFVKTMLRLGAEKKEINVIDDQIGSPTYARDLAAAILAILPKLDSEGVKTYHYTNEGICSWYNFARAIMEYKRLPCKVNPIPTTEYPTPAERPMYSVLSKRALKMDFRLVIPHWRDALKECLVDL